MLCDWGYSGSETEGVARVVSTHGDYFHLVCNERNGEIIARTKSSAFRDLPSPTTGDFVRFAYNASGESRIMAILPRFSQIERLDPSSSGMKAQTLAVNFDTLFFAMSLNENFSLARLERFLALAKQSGCIDRIVLLLTKADLDSGTFDFSALPDIPTIRISARSGIGLSDLAEYAKPRKTIAFIGSSGVGKSTLVNSLAGDEWMATGEIQEWSGKGRHTTTSRELVMLPCGAMALDTPGLREIGLLGTDGFDVRGRNGGTHRWRDKRR